MFVELFYPKELRRLIEKYRKEGTLNETIVKKLRKDIYVGLSVYSIVFWMFLDEFNIEIAPNQKFYWLVILFFLALLLLKQEIHGVFYRNIVPYVDGQKIKVKVLKSELTGFRAKHLYAVYELNNEKIYCKYAGYTRHYKLQLYELSKKESVLNKKKVGFISKIQSYGKIGPNQEGETCFIYQSNLDKSKGMPDIKFFKENYSLTTSIL